MKSEKIKHIYHVQGTFSLLVIIEQRRAWVEGSRGCAKQPGATVCGVELKTRRVERMTCSALYLLYFSNKCPMWFSTINRSMTSKKGCGAKSSKYHDIFPFNYYSFACWANFMSYQDNIFQPIRLSILLYPLLVNVFVRRVTWYPNSSRS